MYLYPIDFVVAIVVIVFSSYLFACQIILLSVFQLFSFVCFCCCCCPIYVACVSCMLNLIN